MTQQEYEAVLARINKAEALPYDELRPYLGPYHDLCTQAANYEMARGNYYQHTIHDKQTREIIVKLLDDIQAARDALGGDADLRHRKVLSDLMALAMTPDDRVLEIWGYKEVAEDDE